MCGICGIVGFRNAPPVEAAALERMTRRMTHRGPDGDGYWYSSDRRIGFGHRRLSIVDLSANGTQPMSDSSGDTLITFNGEIYNFASLRSELEARGVIFQSKTDTEVLIYLYKQYGLAMLDRLEGDFAFAIWDQRKRQLFLARDHAGVKPIYFARVGQQFVFASEVSALLASGMVAPEVDEGVVFDYLTYLTSPRLKSLVRGVEKLPPGGAMLLDIETGQERRWRFWDPLPNMERPDTSSLDEQFEDLFLQAVNKRRMADVPVGVLFSGGVDSTLNVAEFKKAAPDKEVHTFTVGMPGTVNDEGPRARRIAERLGTIHHEVLISEDDVLGTMSTILRAQDEPVSDPVCLPLYFVTKLARESGTIVLQAGEGADEIFCGYDAYKRFLSWRERFWNPLSRMPRFIPQLAGAAVGMLNGVWPQARKVADICDRMAAGREFFMSSAVSFYEAEKQHVLGPEFRRRMAGHDSYSVVEPLYAHLAEKTPDATFLQCITYLELNQRLPELLLMRLDKIGMANSIEGRVPFLDHKLISFAMSVPDSFKLENGIGKAPVKRLAARAVPPDEIYRPKTGFGAPIQKWFAGRLGQELLGLLEDRSTEAERFIDVAHIRDLVKRTPRTGNEAFQLWVIYNFLFWNRQMHQDAKIVPVMPAYSPPITSDSHQTQGKRSVLSEKLEGYSSAVS